MVDEKGYQVEISSTNGVPSFFAAIQTAEEGSTSTLRYSDLSATAATLYVQDETPKADRAKESVGYVSLSKLEGESGESYGFIPTELLMENFVYNWDE
jgi:hypothetical protein